MQCVLCKQVLKTFYFSKTTNEKLIDINFRSVHAAASAGGGTTLLETSFGSMNLPPPFHTAPYSQYLKFILKFAIDNYEESMKHGALTGIAVSCDGTWRKRYVHNLVHYSVLLLPFQ